MGWLQSPRVHPLPSPRTRAHPVPARGADPGPVPRPIVHAAARLPDGLVLDGELLVWAGEHLSFEALQRRAASQRRTAARLAEQMTAHFVVFDALQIDGHELLRTPYRERRARLETVFAEHHLVDPWTLCPETGDVAVAQEWLMSWTEVPGLEGLIIREASSTTYPGPAHSSRSADGTPPRASSARSPARCAARGALCWADTFETGSCGPSPAAQSCSPAKSGISPIISSRPRGGTRGRASGSPRHGVPVPRWTSSWSSLSWSPRYTWTPPRIEGSGGIPRGTYDFART
ncbi:hypothetical protein [Streptomyces thermocarboxydovorans]|uniref:ATP-dependent DNA ligase n=1 Tax=Streptomyces thermocarboxydovorans TaxID=59298 RepID=UPI0031DAF9C6